jgi:hypothetical protein
MWSVDVHRHRSEGRRQPASVFVCRMRIRQRWLRFRLRRGSDRAILRDRVQHDHSGPALASARILHRSDHVNRRTVKDYYVDICAPPDDGRERNRQVSSNVIESPSFNREPPEIISCPTAIPTKNDALIEGPQRALRANPSRPLCLMASLSIISHESLSLSPFSSGS